MPFGLSSHPNILRYLKRVGARKAYRDAMAKDDPNLEPMLGGPAPELFSGMKLQCDQEDYGIWKRLYSRKSFSLLYIFRYFAAAKSTTRSEEPRSSS